MIWSHYARSHWQSHDFQGLILEVKVIKGKDRSFSPWRITKDGVTLKRGQTDHPLESMKIAKSYAESIALSEKSKSQIIAEFCKERGIPVEQIKVSDVKDLDVTGFPTITTDVSQ